MFVLEYVRWCTCGRVYANSSHILRPSPSKYTRNSQIRGRFPLDFLILRYRSRIKCENRTVDDLVRLNTLSYLLPWEDREGFSRQYYKVGTHFKLPFSQTRKQGRSHNAIIVTSAPLKLHSWGKTYKRLEKKMLFFCCCVCTVHSL